MKNLIRRTLSYLIDVLIVSIWIGLFNYINITIIKSAWFYLIVLLISILYKPLFEFYFTKSIGKYLFNLNVLDINLNKLSIFKAFMRNFIFIASPIVSAPFYFLTFQNSSEINTVIEFGNFLAVNYPLHQFIVKIPLIMLLVDFLFLVFDSKKNISLHDRIASTRVINQYGSVVN